MTQLEAARDGRTTDILRAAAARDDVAESRLRDLVASGRAVIPANVGHTNLAPVAIGEGLPVKINANIGTSPERACVEEESAKLRAALDAGAHAVMDLSTGGDLHAIRRELIAQCPAVFGTVPIYEVAVELGRQGRHVTEMEPDHLFRIIERHAQDGVDFITVHCGVVRDSVARLQAEGRTCDIVSRGGAFLAAWILANEQENPLYSRFDDLLEICRRYDVTLSLGDGLRPGCLADATDRAQVAETIVLGELVDRARAAGVQAMVEGPGHVPLDQIEANVRLEKRLCHGAPFYVLGPIVTDLAPGYDHISGAIGGALAAWAGADFLCYVTPAEHLGLPTPADVRQGVVASRIAAHAADIARGLPGARERDDAMGRARRARDWERQAELAMDPEAVRASRADRETLRRDAGQDPEDACSMCGRFCSVRIAAQALRGEALE